MIPLTSPFPWATACMKHMHASSVVLMAKVHTVMVSLVMDSTLLS